MENKDKEYEKLLQEFEDDAKVKAYDEKPKNSKKPDASKSKKQPSVHSKNEQAAKKRRTLKGVAVLAVAVFAAALAIITAFSINSSSKSTENAKQLGGVWYYDAYTEYEFDGNGNGCMCIDETNHYEFKYTVKGDTLKIDYVPDYVGDCEYTFKLKGDRLTLIGGKGTSEPGREYNLERVKH